MNEADILDLIKNDEQMMEVLRTVESLNLPDWLIGAGFIRNKVWDHLHEYKERTISKEIDVDVAYLNYENQDEEKDKQHEISLQEKLSVKWEVINQSRMSHLHGHSKYRDISDALSYWPETATCVGVRLESGELKLFAPHGIGDLINMKIRICPRLVDEDIFEKRYRQKEWFKKWPKVKLA